MKPFLEWTKIACLKCLWLQEIVESISGSTAQYYTTSQPRHLTFEPSEFVPTLCKDIIPYRPLQEKNWPWDCFTLLCKSDNSHFITFIISQSQYHPAQPRYKELCDSLCIIVLTGPFQNKKPIAILIHQYFGIYIIYKLDLLQDKEYPNKPLRLLQTGYSQIAQKIIK